MTDAYENEYDFQCVHSLKIVNVWLVSRQTKKSLNSKYLIHLIYLKDFFFLVFAI